MILPLMSSSLSSSQLMIKSSDHQTDDSMMTTTTIQPTTSSSMVSSNDSSSVSQSSVQVECAGCGLTIMDRYYLSAVDQHWHGSCLKCSQCKQNLQTEPSCFSRDGLIFCKTDYYRLFTMRRCSRCGEGIYASELVMRVRDQNVYHIQCFTCAWCNVTLSQGDLFGIRDNLVYCRNHYQMLCSTPSPTSLFGSPNINSNHLGHHHLQELNLHHSHHHPHHPHHHSHQQQHGGSPMRDSIIPGDNCSTMAATPYSSSVGIYSPLSITNLSTSMPNLASNNNGQSPTTPQSIRKGRPRKRKNLIDSQTEQINTSHESLSPSRSVPSPSVSNALDGGPLSGLAASIENSCNSQLSSSAALNLAAHQGNQRTKRMRTSFKHHQLRTMKTYFAVNQNPDAKDLKQLAQKTGLSKRVLQVWFQNARAKWRRNNLKMLPDGQADLSSLSGQTILSMGHPSTPSTVIGSPSDSTRPFSSPSPDLSPSENSTSLSHQPMLPSSGLSSSSSSNVHHHHHHHHHHPHHPPPHHHGQQQQQQTQQPSSSSLEAFVSGQNESSSNLIPISFQELF